MKNKKFEYQSKKMGTILRIAFIVSSVGFARTKSYTKYEKQTIVLLSFDGFRHDYVDLHNLKNFKELTINGVKAKSLQPTFVTKTLPSHFTMVTGLYEESHGIVSNYMYDPLYKEYFDPVKSSMDPKWWDAATPIWILNEIQFMKNSKRTRKSATLYWAGSETSYNNHWPYYTIKDYTSNFTVKQRFDKIVDLLLEPDPVNFVACYFEEPDNTSHIYGPDGSSTLKVLKQLDDLMGYFIQKMKFANLYDKVNVIVVSDHGMAKVNSSNVIKMTDHLNKSDYDLVNYGTFLSIRPEPAKKEQIYKNLQKIKHVKTYYKSNIPEQWHYKHNRRITEILSVADEGYYLAPGNKDDIPYPKGDHGYDNKLKSMHGIFLAHGPAFKKNLNVGTIYTIDLCSLMCHLLDIKPHPNNGSLDRIKYIVMEKTLSSVIMKSPALIIVFLSVCGIFILIVILGCTVSCFRNLVENTKYSKLNEQDVPLGLWQEDEDITEFELRRR